MFCANPPAGRVAHSRSRVSQNDAPEQARSKGLFAVDSVSQNRIVGLGGFSNAAYSLAVLFLGKRDEFGGQHQLRAVCIAGINSSSRRPNFHISVCACLQKQGQGSDAMLAHRALPAASRTVKSRSPELRDQFFDFRRDRPGPLGLFPSTGPTGQRGSQTEKKHARHRVQDSIPLAARRKQLAEKMSRGSVYVCSPNPSKNQPGMKAWSFFWRASG